LISLTVRLGLALFAAPAAKAARITPGAPSRAPLPPRSRAMAYAGTASHEARGRLGGSAAQAAKLAVAVEGGLAIVPADLQGRFTSRAFKLTPGERRDRRARGGSPRASAASRSVRKPPLACFAGTAPLLGSRPAGRSRRAGSQEDDLILLLGPTQPGLLEGCLRADGTGPPLAGVRLESEPFRSRRQDVPAHQSPHRPLDMRVLQPEPTCHLGSQDGPVGEHGGHHPPLTLVSFISRARSPSQVPGTALVPLRKALGPDMDHRRRSRRARRGCGARPCAPRRTVVKSVGKSVAKSGENRGTRGECAQSSSARVSAHIDGNLRPCVMATRPDSGSCARKGARTVISTA
jgi:hypothetical protein